jgi:hypothetical protein
MGQQLDNLAIDSVGACENCAHWTKTVADASFENRDKLSTAAHYQT